MPNKLVSIVISAFNEQDNVQELYKQLKSELKKVKDTDYELIYVDDGSSDKTYENCLKLQKKDKSVKIVQLKRNFGHEIAMTAGMDYAQGDAVIFMDADLQHPPHYIPQMIELWQQGKEIVLTKRVDNKDTSGLYKLCAKSFYFVLNLLSEREIMTCSICSMTSTAVSSLRPQRASASAPISATRATSSCWRQSFPASTRRISA